MAADLAAAAAVLRRGGLVGMPTETVYGLAADCRDPVAVARVFAAKGRPHFDPLIVHVADPDDAWQVGEPCTQARALAAACWPGPLTLVLPRRAGVLDLVTSGLPTVAVRCPAHPLARALIRAAGFPLVAPSANRFGRISPTCAAAVRDELGAAVDLVLDGGPCAVGVESTIVQPGDPPLLLRPGGVPRERLEEILGRPLERPVAGALAAPGMLASHYAPAARVLPVTEGWPSGRVGHLRFAGPADPRAVISEELSSAGDLVEAASRLFACLRRLDAAGVDAIVHDPVPPHGLGLAIADRLRRAAGRG